ncbi:9015_t:CDS:2 [Dentiscutata heterogama]|uniref:9015_t:CDS:1 n=1 Tax=Dentiscutata heterogama TaxID=1316150 RepID=A0ACA9LMS3_9GLOM|nr:9015_t:CDS:2 [Dentiscutata heterogama]
MSFIYPLPTTGTISFSDFLLDEDHLYLNEISEATAQRGRVRAVLKEANKAEGPKDYTKVMKQTVDDYLPYLLGIVDCLEGGQLKLKKEFETSWRCTLSDSVLKKKRVVCRGIYYELIFTLMTYGYACSNWASSIIEKQPQNDEIDSKLKQAADILRRASGVFTYISEKVCPRWIKPPPSRPPDVLAEISASTSKIAFADASSIAIRKALMQQTSPSLLAKLAIGVAGNYEMANGLIKSLKDSTKVCGDFRNIWSKRQNGKAVGFITEAREILHLLTKCKSPMIAARAAQEYSEVNELYNSYVGINDTRRNFSNSTGSFVLYIISIKLLVTFQVVPSKADLQALIPGGRMVLDLANFTPPAPAFGPGVNKTSRSESGYILENQYY